MFKENWKVGLRKKSTFKLMTVLFTPSRVYMTAIYIQILRYSLIISFELNPHLNRGHVLLGVIFMNTKMP